MDARLALRAALVALVCSLSAPAGAAEVRSANFVVQAPTREIAKQMAEAAERYRRDLAVYWLGKPLPGNWRRPCPVKVQVGQTLGAGGATSFLFDRGEVFGWQMDIQGPLDRLLDSVLPHEVTHTIFASHFRQPLPRWADEGACTTVEHASERRKQFHMLVDQLKTSRGIPFSRMYQMTEYPSDVMPLYSQGHSLVTFLLAKGGPRKFIHYLEDGLERNDWVAVTREHYEFDNLGVLQTSWLDWVRRGSPPDESVLASDDSGAGVQVADARTGRAEESVVVRGQSADEAPEAAVADRSDDASQVADTEAPPARSRYRRRSGRNRAARSAAEASRETEAWRQGASADEADPSEPAAQGEEVAPPRVVPRRPRQVLLEWSRPAADGSVAESEPLAAPDDETWPHESTGDVAVYDASGGATTLRR
jgi:hypothetical protein